MREPLGYTRDEINSYLPTGWNLADAAPGEGDDGSWTAVVLDGADQAWELEIAPGEAAELGRLEALQRAFDRIYRAALGRAGIMG